MNFLEIAEGRQSCRSYDSTKNVEEEKLSRILEAARLSPSACNGQPYHITVCRGEAAGEVARAVQGMGMNKFASEAPILLVISERPYVTTAALGAKVKGNDYRSMDIGILSAYLTAAATAEGTSAKAVAGMPSALKASENSAAERARGLLGVSVNTSAATGASVFTIP